MQMLAKELHVPVTAFVWKDEKDWRIRYFTAQGEIDACGHAMLAAAALSTEICKPTLSPFGQEQVNSLAQRQTVVK